MANPAFRFTLLHTDAHCRARRSRFATPHGTVEMPAFMPVATQGSVKGIGVEPLRAAGTQMVLGNT
ncbi:MAG: tRNA-guanine transglycosylase, partial [Thermoguttaceae bacterium]